MHHPANDRSGSAVARRAPDPRIRLFAALIVLSGCGGEPTRTVDQPAQVTVTSPRDTLNAIGHSMTLSATVFGSSGSPLPNVRVTWAALDPAVSVDANGAVVAQAVGTGRVVASVDLVSDTTTLIVRQVPRSITIEPPAWTLELGESIQLTATAEDSGGTAIPLLDFAWNTGNVQLASVSESGLVQSIALGACDITVQVAGLSNAFSVAVVPHGPVRATRFRITDPLQDNEGSVFDYSEVRELSGWISDDSLAVTISFDEDIAPISAGLPTSTGGGIYLDVDQSPATGRSIRGAIGADYLIAFGDSAAVSVPILILGSPLPALRTPAFFTPRTITAHVGLDTINEIDGQLDLAATLSISPSNADWVPNTGSVTITR